MNPMEAPGTLRIPNLVAHLWNFGLPANGVEEKPKTNANQPVPLGRLQFMKRALFFTWFTAMLVVGTGLAQTARQEMVPAPLSSDSAPVIPAHPSPNNFPGV